MKSDKKMGTVTVSKKAALQAAEFIAKNTHGVSSMTDRSKRGDISRFFLGKGNPKGVYMTKSDEGVNIEIYVICSYGTNAGDVCKNISSRVRAELEDNMGIPLNRVTVRVEGVDASGK